MYGSAPSAVGCWAKDLAVLKLLNFNITLHFRKLDSFVRSYISCILPPQVALCNNLWCCNSTAVHCNCTQISQNLTFHENTSSLYFYVRAKMNLHACMIELGKQDYWYPRGGGEKKRRKKKEKKKSNFEFKKLQKCTSWQLCMWLDCSWLDMWLDWRVTCFNSGKGSALYTRLYGNLKDNKTYILMVNVLSYIFAWGCVKISKWIDYRPTCIVQNK